MKPDPIIPKVTLQVFPSAYRVDLFNTNETDITRYFTDDTLPDELKWKLGLLSLGMDSRDIGWRIGSPVESRYRIKVSIETYRYIRGWDRNDAGGQSKNEGT